MVFRIALLIVAAFVAWGIAAPGGLAATTAAWLAASIQNFGWYYLLVVFGILVFALVVAFGRFGRIRLGGDDAAPDFSTASWFAMLFSAGMGIGLVFWGVAEPLSHYLSPPGYVTAGTPDAARFAMRASFFHWGLHPWALYAVVGMALAYFKFNRGAPGLLSAAFEPLLGQHARGPAGKMVDVLAIVATVFGVATSLGFGATQIAGGLHHVFGIEASSTAILCVIAIATVLFLVSSTTGLERGIKWLSNTNMILAVGLCLAVLLMGPTLFVMEALTSTVGAYISGLVQQSMRLTPFTQGSWTSDWTIFYWAWWITWAPFVGMFIARISRGRTIREFMVGVMLVPSLVSFIWFAVFGGTALHLQIMDGLQIAQAAQASPDAALFLMLDALPLGQLLSVLAIVLVSVFFVTSADSATFVLAMLSSRGSLNPAASMKLVWGLTVSVIAAVLLLAGGLKGLQTMSILAALPFTLVLIGLCVSTWKALAADAHAIEVREQAMRKALRQMAMREITEVQTEMRD
ncbi:BCCT family transporter [Niveibacterium sp. 24ML]|uniref:glycine betaine uptake BCCT transporter n=1 Tax=Niveibacterium sp. 24ML TaxID=2985512 RepID=UPI00226FB6A0|nr:BCCT family transporter [Niveibacterium sp. 24ML]MCX9155197.1 BCCT family transporter [Niveibacterium sp. 24ML]